MTPFGERIRKLRAERQVTQKQMAAAIGVSSAYLSALEHGKRGRPSWYLIQRIINYFNVIWDDADQIIELAHLSHPRITIDTSGLSPKATALANHLADQIGNLREEELDRLLSELEASQQK
ncbi:MAG: helix-turn-helix domain-containing protein [Hyphomicrobiales bacterium]|nr:helix-turn-helix domain-containing protein [Hyphomicrobiales bacterium]